MGDTEREQRFGLSDGKKLPYGSFVGQWVVLRIGTDICYGNVHAVDYEDGTMILDRVPSTDFAQQKPIQRDGVVVKLDQIILLMPTTEAEINGRVERTAAEFALCGKEVQIDEKHHGKLTRLVPGACLLNPYLGQAPGFGYFLVPEEVSIPHGDTSVVVPLREGFLEQLVAKSDAERRLRELRQTLEGRKLQKAAKGTEAPMATGS